MVSSCSSRRDRFRGDKFCGKLCGLFALILLCASLTFAQNQTAPEKPAAAPANPNETSREKAKEAKVKGDGKTPTAEQIAETVIAVYGSRPGLAQIRRSGIERGRTTVAKPDGGTEDINFERKFMRGENTQKDRVRLDQKMPAVEYALLFKDNQVSGIINGTIFTPRQQASEDFLNESRHGIDALLRYKENNSQVAFVSKEKIKNIDVWVLDLTDTDKAKTRYYISAQKGRVLWLEYENVVEGVPTKFKRTFHDYNYAQGTLVPYRTVLYAGDKQVAETRILTVTYGVKLDEAIFSS